MPEEGIHLLRHEDILTFNEITDFTKTAVASGISKVRITGGEPLVRKGIVTLVSMIAGINAAKETSALIPLCHNIVLDNIKVDLFPYKSGIVAESEIHCTGRTGAEMEALVAVSVALITVYDMCKAVDKMMVIDKIMVTEKTKG
jgi:cyclic pyranopterin monophosphate synthase